jgi:hypothetical protein
VAEVEAHLAKPVPGDEAEAGDVVGEELAHDLVVAGALGLLGEGERQGAAQAAPALGPAHVHAAFADPGVAGRGLYSEIRAQPATALPLVATSTGWSGDPSQPSTSEVARYSVSNVEVRSAIASL